MFAMIGITNDIVISVLELYSKKRYYSLRAEVLSFCTNRYKLLVIPLTITIIIGLFSKITALGSIPFPFGSNQTIIIHCILIKAVVSVVFYVVFSVVYLCMIALASFHAREINLVSTNILK